MSSNALAVLPSTEQFSQIKEIANMAVKSGLLPTSIKTAEAAAIIALKGYELGLPPMVAFSHINVINGKPSMSAEIMLAYIYKDHPGCEIDIVEKSETRCVIEARRSTEKKLTKFEWNMERARKMQLDKKDNWVKQPGTMMFWRTITEMKRAKFPEVLMGIDYTPEELGAEVKEDGSPRDVSPRNEQPTAQTVSTPVKEIKNFAPQTAEEAKNWKSEQPKSSDQVTNKEAPEQDAAVEERKQLIGDVKEVLNLLNFTPDQVAQRSNEYFKKNTDKLTNAELKQFAINLWKEFSAVNKGAANE